MRINNALVAGMIVLGWMPSGHAALRACGDETVEVRSAVGEVVEIVLEDGVADLVRSGDPSTIRVEHTAGHLFITPLTNTPASLTVIDRRGHAHRIRHVFGQGVDARIVVGDCGRDVSNSDKEDGSINLMRALMRGQVPSQAVEKDSNAVMFEDEHWRMQAVRVYEMPMLRGYVASIKNRTKMPLMVPLQRMTFPGMVAIAADKDLLGSQEDGVIYMVVGR